LRKFKDSNALAAENAQHDPHYPYYLTGLTAPTEVQSTSAGNS